MPGNSSTGVLSSCFDSRPGTIIFAAFSVSNVLLVPLFLLVLHVAYRRWSRRRRQGRPGCVATATSHLDVLTYHLAALEVLSIVGCCLNSGAGLTGAPRLLWAAMDLFSFSSFGQSLFHALACVERYLAVVHPVTYRGLRGAGGVRVRNLSVGGVWLHCFVMLGQSRALRPEVHTTIVSCLLVFLVAVVSFCSLSVLRALIGPRPGEGGGDRKRADQSKLRALRTVTAITGALWLRFAGLLVAVATSSVAAIPTVCVLGSAVVWLTIPGTLVLPLLFLQRAGKLPGCKRSTESE